MQWAEKIPGLLEILPPIDVKKAANLVFEVENILVVERTPAITGVSLVWQMTNTTFLRVSDARHYEELYLAGRTIIGLLRNDTGKVIQVEVAGVEDEEAPVGIALPNGFISPEYLVLCLQVGCRAIGAQRARFC